MDIKAYFIEIKDTSSQILEESMIMKDEISQSHYFIKCIFDYTNEIYDANQKMNWQNVANQLEAALFSAITGMYRQAFSSLRLAFELGLGLILFSLDKLSFYEWLKGKNDIKWSKIIDPDNGIFSDRYLKIFFPASLDIRDYLKCSAIVSYRELSEYVHGNHETWLKDGLKLEYNENSLKVFLAHFKTIVEILLCSTFIRYANEFGHKNDKHDFLNEILGHHDCIRSFLGGAVSK
ncbi:hypothetical protein HXZ65_03505 [Acinetobacter indicus]|uniref:hypothetical protein n=1 Tax=Acinetobacter indicus TaxID=756892 RepID=UPI002575549A|nr:hypothetical protein [Acinetobacter indicus]MDM1277331.1 hypothetical protein [Acinetobacter indicus]